MTENAESSLVSLAHGSSQTNGVLSSGILKFCIRGLLGDNKRRALNELCDVIQLLCALSICTQDLDSLEYRVHHVLSLLERDFPVTMHVITLHMLHHLLMYLRRFGPVYGYWMYPMERFNSWISCRILNRRYPEATVLETFWLYELSFFLHFSSHLPNSSVADIGSDAIHEEGCEEAADGHSNRGILLHNDPLNHGRDAMLEADLMQELQILYRQTCVVYHRVLVDH